MEPREKQSFAFISDEKSAIDEEARSIRFVISSDKLDRDNERVEVSAVADAIKDFSKNPCCLACHLHRLENGSSPVIGSWDTNSFKAYKKHSEMNLVFAKTAMAEDYWQLYKDRHMRAVSIGFRVLEGHEEKRNNVRTYVITKIELFEISCVPVGANREALSKLKAFGAPDNGMSEKAIKDAVAAAMEEQLKQIKDLIEDAMDEIKDLTITDPDGLADHPLGGDPDPYVEGGDDTEQTLKMLDTVHKKLKGNSDGSCCY